MFRNMTEDFAVWFSNSIPSMKLFQFNIVKSYDVADKLSALVVNVQFCFSTHLSASILYICQGEAT